MAKGSEAVIVFIVLLVVGVGIAYVATYKSSNGSNASPPLATEAQLQKLYGAGGAYNYSEISNVPLAQGSLGPFGFSTQIQAFYYITYKINDGEAYFILINTMQPPNFVSINGDNGVPNQVAGYLYEAGSEKFGNKFKEALILLNPQDIADINSGTNASTIVAYDSAKRLLILVYLQNGLAPSSPQATNAIVQWQ